MAKNLPDIEYAENSDIDRTIIPFIDSKKSLYTIPYYKDEYYFSNLDSYQKFVKAVEKLVRTSDRYNKYKAYLTTEAKMDHCQVLKDIDSDDASIEMHHGPIFTLYDYCTIMLEYFLINDMKITTFRVADEVLKEHENNNIQVVMLSTTIHEQVHNRNIFISPDQAFGNLHKFTKKYASAIGPELRDKFNRYCDRAIISDSTDYGTLELNNKLWSLSPSSICD